jgi:hypothetical protein
MNKRLVAPPPRRVLWLVAFLCFLVVYGAWYPGVFTLDEKDIVAQGLSGQLHDGHSPLLVQFWALTHKLKPGPSIPYLIGLVFVLVMATKLLYELLGTVLGAAASLCGLILLPPVFVALALVTKDLFFVGAMLLVVRVVARYARQPQRRTLVCALLAMQLAVLLRIDAVFALLPVALYLGSIVGRTRNVKPAATAILSLVGSGLVLIALLAGTKLFAQVVLRAKPLHAEQVMMLFDLSAISLAQDRVLIPASRHAAAGFPLTLIRARFDNANSDELIWSKDSHQLIYAPGANHAELHQSWRQAVMTYPASYLRFRTEYAAAFMGIRYNREPLRGQFTGDGSMARNPEAGWEPARSPMQRLYAGLANSPSVQFVYMPWFWLLCGVFPLLVFGARPQAAQRSSVLASHGVLLVFSAVSYTLLMATVSASALARYHAWPRVAIGVAIVLAVTELVRRCRRRQPEAPGLQVG